MLLRLNISIDYSTLYQTLKQLFIFIVVVPRFERNIHVLYKYVCYVLLLLFESGKVLLDMFITRDNSIRLERTSFQLFSFYSLNRFLRLYIIIIPIQIYLSRSVFSARIKSFAFLAKQILIKTFEKFVQALRRKRTLKIQRIVVLKSRCTDIYVYIN